MLASCRLLTAAAICSLDESVTPVAVPVRSAMAELSPRKALPPLLLKLNEVKPERLDYVGVSFGATSPLFKFWKKCDFVPVYMRQTQVRQAVRRMPTCRC